MISMVKVAVFIFLVLTVFSAVAQAQPPVRVITHYAPNWASSGKQGFASEFFQRLTMSAEIQSSVLNAYPVARALRTFVNDSSDCYFSGNEEFFEQYLAPGELDVITSAPFTGDAVYIFSLDQVSIVSDKKKLSEKRVVTDISVSFLNRILSQNDLDGVDFVHVNDIHSGILMMRSKRADVFVGFYGAIDPMYYHQLYFDKSQPLHTTIDALNCKNTPRGRAYISLIDPIITSGLKDGRFDDLYKKYNRYKPHYFMGY